MIIKDYQSQAQEYFNGRAMVAVYKGAQLVWTAIRSCFGKGYWINEKPWVNDDAWKN
jgi:hypothetical protein